MLPPIQADTLRSGGEQTFTFTDSATFKPITINSTDWYANRTD
jgi:hypothetical protein